MPLTANHSLQHQLEHDLWIKELGYLNDEINILKRHLPDIYYQRYSDEVMDKVRHFSEAFRLQKEWLHKMRDGIERAQGVPVEAEDENLNEPPGLSSIRLQMQANRLVNQELKDSFFKLFS